MSGIETFFDEARRCFDSATTKTGEFIEVSKFKVEKATLESKVREQYGKLGKLYFDKVERGADTSEQIEVVMERIRELQNDIRVTNEKIGNAKPHKVCPSCNARNTPDNLYCQNCGSKL